MPDKQKPSIAGLIKQGQHHAMPPRDFPARGEKKPAAPQKENTGIQEALILSKLPIEGLQAPDGSAISSKWFNNPEKFNTATDVWNALDPELRTVVRRAADYLDLSKPSDK